MDAAAEDIQIRYGITNLPTLTLLPPGGKPIDASDRILSYVSGAELLRRLKDFDSRHGR
jgi:hypothetical protein